MIMSEFINGLDQCFYAFEHSPVCSHASRFFYHESLETIGLDPDEDLMDYVVQMCTFHHQSFKSQYFKETTKEELMCLVVLSM